MDIKKLVKPNVLSLRAYEAKEIPCRVKLDANESPYGFTFRSIHTNRYPDPNAGTLRKLFARACRVKVENILPGNGSDEIIYYLIATFRGPVMFPTPTFTMYKIISRALNEDTVELPLDNEFHLDADAFLKKIKKRKPGLIFLSSPNNPTGNCFSYETMLKIIRQSPGMVVVDEAYQPFSGRNEVLPLLGKYKNLIILRTLSKVGLAALRVGFMIADRDVINEVNKVRLPFNVNSLSQAAAAEYLGNRGRLRSYIRSIISERKRLMSEMKKIDKIKPYPSDANFILFEVGDPDRMYKGLLKKGILIRNMKGVIKGCLRVTVGTRAENTAFLKALKQLL